MNALSKPSLRIRETLDLYQKSDELPGVCVCARACVRVGYTWELGVTKVAVCMCVVCLDVCVFVYIHTHHTRTHTHTQATRGSSE